MLEFVTPEPDHHVNVLLYGPPKTGKTTGAASAPGPVLVLNADRPNATRFAHAKYGNAIKEVRVTGLDTLIQATLAVEAGDFATVVVDTVGEVYRTVLEDMTDRVLRPQIQWYGDTGTHLERFCRAMVEAPVHAVFVCHELVVEDTDEEADHRPFTGTKNPVLAEKLMAMVDVFGYTGTVLGDDGDSEGKEDEMSYMVQLVNGRGRRGGDRFNALGRVRELDLSEWIDTIHRASSPDEKKK